MGANNVLQEMQAVRDLTASFLELLQRDVDVLAQTIHLLQMTNRPRFVSAKPPCLTGMLASLPQLLLKGAGVRVDLKYSLFPPLLQISVTGVPCQSCSQTKALTSTANV